MKELEICTHIKCSAIEEGLKIVGEMKTKMIKKSDESFAEYDKRFGITDVFTI